MPPAPFLDSQAPSASRNSRTKPPIAHNFVGTPHQQPHQASVKPSQSSNWPPGSDNVRTPSNGSASRNSSSWSSAASSKHLASGHLSSGPLNGAAKHDGKTIHPLKHIWTVSFVRRNSGQKVAEDQWAVEKISEVGSIESFWNVWSHLKRPSTLQAISEYYIFPTWEDPYNATGGKWVVRLRKGLADRMWEELVMALLGERLFPEEYGGILEANDDICGCVVSIRKDEDLISIWHSDGASSEKKERLRVALQACLELHEDTIITYRANSDNLADRSMNRRKAANRK